jgi:acyl dehydratase
MSDDQVKTRPRLVYWEDLVDSIPRRYGPLMFTTALLDQLLDLLGEKHPLHDDDHFARSLSRRRRIIPGGFIHSITSGWIVQHGAPAAVVGLRSITWDFVRPLYPDVPFFFTNHAKELTELDERMGLVKTERRVVDEEQHLYAIGRMNAVMLRRPRVVDGSGHVIEGSVAHSV